MRFSLLIALFLAGAVKMTAQNPHVTVYLNDGSIIHGRSATVSSGLVTVRQMGGNVLVYNDSNVVKVIQAKHRVANYTSAGFIMGSALNEKPVVLSVLNETNIRFAPLAGAGLTTGVELLNETTIPLAATLKIYLPLKINTLYFSATLGKSFAADMPRYLQYEEVLKAYGGILAGCHAGIIIPLNVQGALFFEAGYRYNELNYKFLSWNYGQAYRTHYLNRLSMRFGLVLY